MPDLGNFINFYENSDGSRRFNAQTALVTGASRGIGRAIAAALAHEGCSLILTCRHSGEALFSFSRDLTLTEEVKVVAKICDMGDPDAVRSLFCDIPSLDFLINNAGISHTGLLQEMTDAQWNEVLSSNLSSVFYTCREAIPYFLQAGSGRIINISSVWGSHGGSCEAAYSASKGGVNALTKALAKELSPSGIAVNAIACGLIDTKMNDHLSEDEKEALKREIPAGRFAAPQEVAKAVLSLLSMPTYLTGQIIEFDGGWM